MRTVDFSPLFAPLYRSAIGFDRISQLIDAAHASDAQPSYPPYNIERVADDRYAISMAVAGFSQSEIDLETENGMLKITGRKSAEVETKTYLHRGIANRSFERRFQLADHVKVVNATIDNGMLQIELVREIPEILKPRKIEINARAGAGATTSANASGNVDFLVRKAA